MFLKIGRGSIPELNELGPIESVDTWNLYRKRLMASPFLLAWAIPIGILGQLGRVDDHQEADLEGSWPRCQEERLRVSPFVDKVVNGRAES